MLFVAFPLLLLIFALCVEFLLVWLICILGFFAFGLSCLGLWVSWTWITISFPFLWKFWAISSLSIFSCLLFVFFFWDTYHSNVGAFNIVPEVSEVVLISFNSFFLSVSFISTILSSTSLILSSASVILLFVPSRAFLISLTALLYIDSFLFLLGPW